MKQKLKNYVPEFVYGAFDGIVTTFAVVAAAAGAGLSSVVVIVLGLANLVADGFSMGASAYLSHRTGKDGHSRKASLFVGGATFLAFLVAGAMPLVPYVYSSLAGDNADSNKLFLISCILAVFTFVLVGYGKSDRRKAKSIAASLAETVLLGLIAAGLSYFLGVGLASAFGI